MPMTLLAGCGKAKGRGTADAKEHMRVYMLLNMRARKRAPCAAEVAFAAEVTLMTGALKHAGYKFWVPVLSCSRLYCEDVSGEMRMAAVYIPEYVLHGLGEYWSTRSLTYVTYGCVRWR